MNRYRNLDHRLLIFFFTQKTAYEMRISDWSSDVCSSDLLAQQVQRAFIDVQIADQLVWISERRLETERQLQTEALRRVRGYRDPLFVETRASARVTSAELALEQAQARSAAARDLLASYWGGDGQGLEIAGGIERPTGVPSALAGADADVREAAIARASAEVRSEEHRVG